MKHNKRLGLILLIVIFGGWLRVWRIGYQSLWFDETFSRNVAVDSDIPTILRNGVAGDVHPPLYFGLLNAWVGLTGDSVVALRFLSALISILGLPAFYHLARLMFNEQAGLIALLLCALSPFQVYYAQEARQYTLSVTLAAWSAVGLIALIRGRRYGWLLYVLAGAGALYTHYFTVLMLAALHLWLIAYRPARLFWRRWLTADLAIAILFVPQFLQFSQQAQAVFGDFWIERPTLGSLVATPTELLFGDRLPFLLVTLTEVLVIVILAVILMDMLRRAPQRIRTYWWLCILVVLLPLIVTLIYSLVRSPLYLKRSFALLTPFLIAALAGGVIAARRPSPTPILIVILIILMLTGIVYQGLTVDPAKPPYRQIAQDLQADPGALAIPVLHLHDATYLPMRYYAPALDQRLVDLQARSWLFPRTWEIFGVKRMTQGELDNWLAGYRGQLRVVSYVALEAPGKAVLDRLKRESCSVGAMDYPPNVTVYLMYLGPCLARRYVP